MEGHWYFISTSVRYYLRQGWFISPLHVPVASVVVELYPLGKSTKSPGRKTMGVMSNSTNFALGILRADSVGI